MIRIGEYNTLFVKKERDFGYFLGEDLEKDNKEEVLIPFSNIPEKKLELECEVEVFIYKDSKDRRIATLKQPLATVGEVALLEVVSKTPIGYFVDFGLERDVLVPFKEVAYDLKEGQKYLFYLYLDKSERITATTFVDKYLHNTNHLKVGEEVLATAYGVQENGTVMVAIQNMYRAVILQKENFCNVTPGQVVNVRIKRYYEDGKMEVTPRKKRLDEMDELENAIVLYLQAHNNEMHFCDSSDPEDIKNTFRCSKNAFKRSLGGLMKKGMISQDERGTKLLSDKPVKEKSFKGKSFKNKSDK
ncbi:hypothetical protein SAMN02745248_02002 [Hathewaya proteolytica DSM 3090]|uniref:S1 motif domain-containing protein n=1 Tax=Hathewaya proteolytica DSM 3090 TaxID=1121331 RepID=A0A1M6QF76_9CLOT|nr:S1-like domain-containing RNA-binding protein [Hathewaya proteolytica]SHK18856.1 hypothetical protein SAMN02745248_02002 [Hathewaya proteolytica DSM 3090]